MVRTTDQTAVTSVWTSLIQTPLSNDLTEKTEIERLRLRTATILIDSLALIFTRILLLPNLV